MSRPNCTIAWRVGWLLPIVLGAWPVYGQDGEAFDRTPADCLPVSSIRRTEVVDNQTILFYMRNRKVYRNYLAHECPGLERENRFSYKVYNARLCSIDTITVLQQFAGRIEPGFTCRLGEFHPLSPEEVEDLKVKRKRRGEPDEGDIEVERADPPAEESAEQPEGGAN
jgi:hypothetical protein